MHKSNRLAWIFLVLILSGFTWSIFLFTDNVRAEVFDSTFPMSEREIISDRFGGRFFWFKTPNRMRRVDWLGDHVYFMEVPWDQLTLKNPEYTTYTCCAMSEKKWETRPAWFPKPSNTTMVFEWVEGNTTVFLFKGNDKAFVLRRDHF